MGAVLSYDEYCRGFGSILGPYPLDVINTPPHPTPSCDNQTWLQSLPNVLCGENHPWYRITVLGKRLGMVHKDYMHLWGSEGGEEMRKETEKE